MKTHGQLEHTSSLLAGLTDEEHRLITVLAASEAVPPGTVLCRQGEPAERVFLVRSGTLRFGRTTFQGRDVLLRRLVPGDCFGLASFVPGAVNYMATAVALEDACVDVWEGETMRSAAATCPRLSENALRIALEYLEQFSERHVALLTRTAEQRVARTITHLGATSGRVLPTGVEVDISNHDLAAMADVGMFTVSRQLKRWEREGHLLKKRQKVLIRHPEALLTD